MPKVSILLPICDSLEKISFLQQMLNSIVHQTYKNFELLILGNQQTVKVCETMARRDSRIKVYIDTKQRSTGEAVNKLTSVARGEFITVVCADALLNHHYIKILVDELKVNESVDMVYTNGRYINANNQIGQSLITDKDGVYNSEYYYENFCKAIHSRKVLPFVFGLFRKEVYQTLWPCKALQTNTDNLWASKFFLNKLRASFVDCVAFYCRQHNKPLEIEGIPTNPISVWVYYVRQQLYFYHAVCSLIDEAGYTEHTTALKMAALDSCLNHCVVLLSWVEHNLARDAFEHAIIEEVYKQYEPIYKLRLPLMYPQSNIRTHQDIMRLRCKILEERVMGCIIPIVQDTTIVLDTQNIVAGIKRDIIKQLSLGI